MATEEMIKNTPAAGNKGDNKPAGDKLAAGRANLEGSKASDAGTAVLEKPDAGKPATPKPDAAKTDAKAKSDDKAKDATATNDKPAETSAPRKAKIETMTVLSRGGLNTQREEQYPFSELGMSRANSAGVVSGPSFFIPKKDNPNQQVATARKRARGQDVQFITRKTAEVVEGEEHLGKQEGQRVWKAKAGTSK